MRSVFIPTQSSVPLTQSLDIIMLSVLVPVTAWYQSLSDTIVVNYVQVPVTI